MSINWDNAYAAKDQEYERQCILEDARDSLKSKKADEIRALFQDAASGTQDVYVPYTKYVGGKPTLDYMSIWDAVSGNIADPDVWTAFQQMAVSCSEADKSAFWDEAASAYISDVVDELVDYDMEHDDDDYDE